MAQDIKPEDFSPANEDDLLAVPDYYSLSAALGYKGSSVDFSHSRYTAFELNTVYLFPILAPGQVTDTGELLVAADKLVPTHTVEIEASIKALEQDSPFKNSDIINSLKEAHDYESRLPSVDHGSEFSQDELLISRSFEDQKLPDSHPVTDGSAFAGDSPNFPSMEPAPELSQEQLSLIADNATILSEGAVQVLPHLLEDGLSPMNPLVSQMKVNLFRVPEKLLVSIEPSEVTEEDSVVNYFDMFYSPITVKLAFCQADGSILSLINAAPTCGFTTTPYLEYSDDSGWARLDLTPSKLHLRLLAQSVLDCIGSTEVVSVSFGFEHAALLTSTGKVMTWGFGGSGCLGHKDTNSQLYPMLVGDLLRENAVYLECGGYHTVCVTDNGELYTWGRGDVHQLGIGFKRLTKDAVGYYSAKPIKLTYFSQHACRVHSAACGEAHTLVLDSEGRVYSFGWGEDGQLGISRHLLTKALISSQVHRVQMPVPVRKVAAGSLFSACMTRDGRVFVWGNGEQGQLGQRAGCHQSDSPIEVAGLQSVLDLQCGESSVICLDAEQTVWGWGLGKARDVADPTFSNGADIVCYAPKRLQEVESVLHLKIDKASSPASMLPDLDYQERVSELAEQLRTLYSEH